MNQQLAWAQVALDQAWVCNDVLGCGLVDGYGPSRAVYRRPQYAWFFAGDALIAIDALLNTGEYDRAREALAFIARYQDASTGMVWHELSQSADPADRAAKYPYMFVHVDITFQYLITVERYVAASGDSGFYNSNGADSKRPIAIASRCSTHRTGSPVSPPPKKVVTNNRIG